MHKLISAAAALAGGESAEDAAKASIDAFTHIKEHVLDGGQVLLESLIIFLVGWWLVNLLCKFMKKALSKANFEPTAATFINSITKYALRALLFIIVISKLGVDMTSIVAIFTSIALAIGLSLQGSLANIAGGLLILVMKPFRVGDYIDDDNGHEGTVKAIEMIYTQLVTVDNKTIWIPNGTLANSSITNLTGRKTRTIDFSVGIDYNEDIDRVRAVLLETARTKYTQDDPAPLVFVKEFQASSVLMVLRLSVATQDYWPAKYAIQEAIKKAFDANGISIPYDHLDVKVDCTRQD